MLSFALLLVSLGVKTTRHLICCNMYLNAHFSIDVSEIDRLHLRADILSLFEHILIVYSNALSLFWLLRVVFVLICSERGEKIFFKGAVPRS